jgi:anti-anti-sigma regulatory factor
MLNVNMENLGEGVVLRCQGELVRGEESSLLCAALGNYGRDIIVDLSEVEMIDAAGSGALLALQAAGVYLRLQNPSAPVLEFLRGKEMDSLFEIFGSDVPLENLVEVPAQFSIRAA